MFKPMKKARQITFVTIWLLMWELMGSNHRPSACKASDYVSFIITII